MKDKKPIVTYDKKKLTWVLLGLAVGITLGILVLFALGGDL